MANSAVTLFDIKNDHLNFVPLSSLSTAVKVVHHPNKGNGRKKRLFNHEFIFRFGSDHDTFKTDVDLRISFVRTLAR